MLSKLDLCTFVLTKLVLCTFVLSKLVLCTFVLSNLVLCTFVKVENEKVTGKIQLGDRHTHRQNHLNLHF